MNLWCWLVGHEDTRWFHEGRVFCRCERCGAETAGLAHDPAGPKPRRVKYKTVAERMAGKAHVLKMKARRQA